MAKRPTSKYEITGNILEQVELFAVGRWNGMEFTIEDLNGIANAFHTLGTNHQVPLKMGHNEEQPMTDGQPALGRVVDVWVEENKLLGKFDNVPDVVFQAIESGLYSKVSVELDMGVEWKEQFFTWVLSGVALLGADIPAVNTLSDLSAFMKRGEELTAKSHFSFSRNVTNEDNHMTEAEIKLQAEVDALKVTNGILTEQNTTLSADRATFSAENVTLKKDADKRKEDDNTTKFASAKVTMTAELDALVKSNHITPAQRDGVIKDFKEDDETLARLQFAVSTLKVGAPTAKLPGNHSATDTDNTETDKDPAEIVVERTKDYMAKNNCSFSVANVRVLEQDKDLARQYLDMNGRKEA